jgi:quercetin dioxygenase-like cupin family protein
MQTRPGPEDWFTGSVWMDHAQTEGGGYFRVLFEPGARTHWHTHPEGQYLHILTGQGRIGTEDGAVEDVKAGDTIFFAPDEKHWHGASPDTFMVHLAISPAINTGGGTDWREPVTDEQYAGGGISP